MVGANVSNNAFCDFGFCAKQPFISSIFLSSGCDIINHSKSLSHSLWMLFIGDKLPENKKLFR